MKKENKKEWEEKKFKELNNLTFEEWWKAGEEENRNFIHQLLHQERLKKDQKWREKIRKMKKCIISRSANWTRDDRVMKMINQALEDLLK